MWHHGHPRLLRTNSIHSRPRQIRIGARAPASGGPDANSSVDAQPGERCNFLQPCPAQVGRHGCLERSSPVTAGPQEPGRRRGATSCVHRRRSLPPVDLAVALIDDAPVCCAYRGRDLKDAVFEYGEADLHPITLRQVDREFVVPAPRRFHESLPGRNGKGARYVRRRTRACHLLVEGETPPSSLASMSRAKPRCAVASAVASSTIHALVLSESLASVALCYILRR